MYTLKIGKYIASYVGTWDYILFIFCVCLLSIYSSPKYQVSSYIVM